MKTELAGSWPTGLIARPAAEQPSIIGGLLWVRRFDARGKASASFVATSVVTHLRKRLTARQPCLSYNNPDYVACRRLAISFRWSQQTSQLGYLPFAGQWQWLQSWWSHDALTSRSVGVREVGGATEARRSLPAHCRQQLRLVRPLAWTQWTQAPSTTSQQACPLQKFAVMGTCGKTASQGGRRFALVDALRLLRPGRKISPSFDCPCENGSTSAATWRLPHARPPEGYIAYASAGSAGIRHASTFAKQLSERPATAQRHRCGPAAFPSGPFRCAIPCCGTGHELPSCRCETPKRIAWGGGAATRHRTTQRYPYQSVFFKL